jgi:hypothetical protein
MSIPCMHCISTQYREQLPNVFQVLFIILHDTWLQVCQTKWSLNHQVCRAVWRAALTWVIVRWGSSSQRRRKCQVRTTYREGQAPNPRLRTQSVTEVRVLCEYSPLRVASWWAANSIQKTFWQDGVGAAKEYHISPIARRGFFQILPPRKEG